MKTKIKLFIGLCMCYVIVMGCKNETDKISPNPIAELENSKSTAPEKKAVQVVDTSMLSIKTNLTIDSLTVTMVSDSIFTSNEAIIPNAEEQHKICGLSSADLEKSIQQAAISLSGVKYSSANLTDCSGMFHKMVQKIKTTCPNALLPTISEARTTRLIAQWYHDNGNLEIIRDAASKGDLIRPGAVLFFGYGLRRNSYDYENLDMATLTTQGIGIVHISVVTSVTKENGKVVSYEMFHGRNPSKPSGITSSKLKPYRDDLPAYGNWDQPLLAVANIITPSAL